MNVLLVHPGFPEPFIGSCRVFVGRKVSSHIPLGLVTVASLFPSDWHLWLRDLVFEDISDQDWNEADLVGITGMCVQDRQIIEIIKEAKKRGKTVLAGGGWASHFPEDVLNLGADLVVEGEAEPIFDEVLERLRSREFGAVITPAEKTHMELAPPPRFDILNLKKYLSMSVQFSRGCPFKCEFCDVTNLMGRKVRTKSPGQVLNELQALYDLGWRNRVLFTDDNFIGIPPRAKTLLKSLIPWMDSRDRPFEFFTQLSANVSSDDELLDLLAGAGFWQVCVGIESTDPETLKRTGKLHNVSLDLDKVCRKIHEAGITMIATFMIGYDNEKPGVDQRVIDFVTRNHIPEVYLHPLRATPGTELWKRLEREGRLLPEANLSIAHTPALMNFVPTRPKAEIAREAVHVYDAMYEPIGFLKRALDLLSVMEPTNAPKSSTELPPGAVQWLMISLYRQGVVYPSRWKFWRLFFSTLVKFPGRFRLFLFYCTFGVIAFEFMRDVISAVNVEMERTEGESTS